jgi:hypothetical protein
LLWLGASAAAQPLRGSGCRNLALPGVYEQALPFSQLLHDSLFAELDAHNSQIQLISGHESKKSLEIYQHLSLDAVEQAYQEAVQRVSI